MCHRADARPQVKEGPRTSLREARAFLRRIFDRGLPKPHRLTGDASRHRDVTRTGAGGQRASRRCPVRGRAKAAGVVAARRTGPLRQACLPETICLEAEPSSGASGEPHSGHPDRRCRRWQGRECRLGRCTWPPRSPKYGMARRPHLPCRWSSGNLLSVEPAVQKTTARSEEGWPGPLQYCNRGGSRGHGLPCPRGPRQPGAAAKPIHVPGTSALATGKPLRSRRQERRLGANRVSRD
jgi:hypothetical protein